MSTFVQHTVKCDCQSSPWHGSQRETESSISIFSNRKASIIAVVKLGIYEENSLLNLLLFSGITDANFEPGTLALIASSRLMNGVALDLLYLTLEQNKSRGRQDYQTRRS